MQDAITVYSVVIDTFFGITALLFIIGVVSETRRSLSLKDRRHKTGV